MSFDISMIQRFMSHRGYRFQTCGWDEASRSTDSVVREVKVYYDPSVIVPGIKQRKKRKKKS